MKHLIIRKYLNNYIMYPSGNWHIPCQRHRWCSFSKGGVLYVGFLEGMNIVKYDFWNWRAFHETFEKQEMGREVGCFHWLWLLMVQEVVETFMHKQQTTNNNKNAQQPTTTTTNTTNTTTTTTTSNNNNNNSSNQNKGEWYNQPTHFLFLGSLFWLLSLGWPRCFFQVKHDCWQRNCPWKHLPV